MKPAIILLFISFAFAGKGQSSSANQPAKPQPAFFIDSQRVDLSRVYLNPDNISSINVVRNADSRQYPDGEIYIVLKAPLPIFQTLGEISRQKQMDGKNILYIIDDSVVKDTTGIKFDLSCIDKISLMQGSDITYLNKVAGLNGILMIETKKKPKSSNQQPILRLR